MANHQTAKYTIGVTLVMCIVASLLVSGSVVYLRPIQAQNKLRDFQLNVLSVAGIYDPSKSVKEQFKAITTKIVDLDSGHYTDAISDPSTFDERSSAKNPELSDKIPPDDDIAKIGRREKYAKVFLVNDDQGLAEIILPVRGYGLWSTLSGFIALDKDLNTVKGFGFYEQQETPGLGGEVDNPKWKKLWIGKKVYSDNGDVEITVIKGHVDDETKNAEYKVDGLSGATMTSNGVKNLLKYWMGDKGFKPYLTNLKNGEA